MDLGGRSGGVTRRSGGDDFDNIRHALAEQASCSDKKEKLLIRSSGSSGDSICCHQNNIKGEEKQPCSDFSNRDYR